MDITTVIAITGVLCSVFGTIIGVLGFLNYNKKEAKQDTKDLKEETKEDVAANTEIKMMLGYIGKDVKDIKFDLKNQADEIKDIRERLIKTESSVSSAHKRIDGIHGA